MLVGPDLVELLGPMGSFLAAFRASGHLNLGLGLRGVGSGYPARARVTGVG